MHYPEMEMVGGRIRERREELRLTQTEAAKAVDTTQPTYSQWETGTNAMSVPQIIVLARALKCPPALFFVDFDDDQERFEREQALRARLNQVASEEIDRRNTDKPKPKTR